MRPDDRSLDYPCPRCKASVGMPCTVALMSARVKELMERALPHPERSALARSESVGGVEPTAPAPPISATTDSDRGRAGSLAMSEQDGIPTPSAGNVENRVAPKNDAASSSLLYCPIGHQLARRERLRVGDERWCDTCARWFLKAEAS